MSRINTDWFAIINPVAGGGKGLQDWPLLSRLLREQGIVPGHAFTERKYHAVELTVEAVNAGYRRILVVGGAGTLHEVVNGLFIQNQVLPRDILLAVAAVDGGGRMRIPGAPQKYSDVVRAMAEGETVLLDVVKISYYKSHYRQTRYMAGIAGIGFDAFTNYKSNHLKEEGHRSKWSRVRGSLATVLGYRSTNVRIWADDRLAMDDCIYSATIGIGDTDGKGRFEIAVVRRMGKSGVMRQFAALSRGRTDKLGTTMLDGGRKIRIESVPEVRVEALGFSPVEFEIVDAAINMVVSRKSPADKTAEIFRSGQ